MVQRVSAIFENGAFHPTSPLDLAEGQHVSLNVETKSVSDELSDVEDLLDLEFMHSCRKAVGGAPSLEEVRKILNPFRGSLADYISEERDER
jgi:predicted DNA-binding antitoxin AbrB/MazE fold protein